jgi:hypothetical protein
MFIDGREEIIENDGIEDIIEHYGVSGMKWGVRKRPSSSERKPTKGQQNRNTIGLKKGSDTGQAAPSTSTYKGGKKATRALSDVELKARLNRLNMEKNYRDLVAKQNPPSAVSRGSKMVGSILVNSGSKAMTSFLGKKVFPAMIESAGVRLRLPGTGSS